MRRLSGQSGVFVFLKTSFFIGGLMSASLHAQVGMVDMNPSGLYLMNLASGTSQNPLSWSMPMLMIHFGHWNTMFMANAFVVDTQQSGPRGGDKLYSTNVLMASAAH